MNFIRATPSMGHRGLLAKLSIVALLVSGLTFVAQPAQASALDAVSDICRSTGDGKIEDTSALRNGYFAANNLRIVPVFSRKLYIDVGRKFDATYIGYRVTNTGPDTMSNLWVELTGFQGGFVFPNTEADTSRRIGSLAANQTKTVYFFIRALGATGLDQRHDVRVYTNDGVTKEQKTACYSVIEGVKRSLSASANKVTSITVTGSPQLGQTINVTVVGAPGKVGQGESPDNSIMALSPASNSSWPSNSLRLESVAATILGLSQPAQTACENATEDGFNSLDTVLKGGTGNSRTILLSNRLVLRNFSACAPNTKQTYSVVYTFRVVANSSSNPAIVPLASISSGTQIKYTGSLPATTTSIPLTETTFPITVTKNFESSEKNGEFVNVTYSLVASTTSASAIVFEEFIDEPDAAAEFVSASYTDHATSTTTTAIRTDVTSGVNRALRFTPSSGSFSTSSSKSATLIYVLRYALPSTDTTFRNLGYILQDQVKIGSSGLVTGIDATIDPAGVVTPEVINQKSPQAIRFELLPSMGLGSSLTISAASDSGLPVSFASSTPEICGVQQINGIWSLFSIAEGNCVVTASQGGDSNFEQAQPVSRSITVLPGQVITEVARDFGASASTTTVDVSATSKLEVSLESLDTDVCTVSVSVPYNATSGLTVYTITKATVSGSFVSAGNCQLVANQGGQAPDWGPAPEKLIRIGFGTAQFLEFVSTNPLYPDSGFVNNTTEFNFDVIFKSVQSNGSFTNLPVSVESLTPNVCLVVLATNADGTLSSGFSSGNTILQISRQGPGTCTLEASQDGLNDLGDPSIYAPATNILREFIMLSAGATDQVVTFDTLEGKAYGDNSFFALVSSTKSSDNSDTGLLVNISSTTENVCVVGASSRDGAKSKAEVFVLRAGTCSLAGQQPGNDTYKIGNGSTSFVISPKQISITGLSGISREYDGTRSSGVSGTASLSGVVPGDSLTNVSIAGTPSVPDFSSELVGEESLQVSGLSLTGDKAESSYILTLPQVTGTITTRPITIKFNDLNANSTPQQFCLPNVSVTVGSLAAGDSLTAIDCNLPAFGSGYANATTTVTPENATIKKSAEDRSSNYLISYFSGSFVVSSLASVTLETPDLEVVYGTVLSALEASAAATDDVKKVRAKHNGNLVPGSLSHKKSGNSIPANLAVGEHLVDVEFIPTDGANFSSQSKTRKIIVKPRKLVVSGLSAVSKEYDGNDSVVLSGTPSLVADPDDSIQGLEILAGDTVTISGTAAGEFGSKNVGTGKTVTVSGLDKSGASSANYLVRVPALTANITKRPLKIGPAQASYSKLKGAADPSFTASLKEGTSFAVGESATTLGGVSVERASGNTATTTGYRVFLNVGSASGKDNYDVETTEALLYIADASINVQETNGTVSSNQVTCECEGFKPGSTVTLTMFSSPVVIKTSTVDSNGNCPLLTGDLPDDGTGSHTLKITGEFPNDDSLEKSKPITFASASGGGDGGGGGGTPTPTASPTPTVSPTPAVTPRPLPTISPARPTPLPTVRPNASPTPTASPSAPQQNNVARGPETRDAPVIIGPTRVAAPVLPGMSVPMSGGSAGSAGAASTIDFGNGPVAAGVETPALSSRELGVRSVTELASEKMGGFAPGAGLRIEVLGAKTGARFVLADLQNIDALVTLRAIESSLPAQSSDFSELTSVRRSEQPSQLESWTSEFQSGADRYFEAVGLERPVGLHELDLSGVKTWLKVDAVVSTYQPGSTVFLVATSRPIVIGIAEVDSFGRASIVGDLPVEALGTGEHRIRVVGTRSLEGVSVDENGEVLLTDAIMAEIQRFDLGTQSTVALSGLNPDGGFHSAIRVVPLVPTAPWWSLIFIPVAFLVAGFIRRRSEDKSFRRLSASALGIVISAIPAVILGWFSTVTSVVWVGLAVGLALAAISWFLPAKKVSAGKNQKSKRVARK